MTFRSSATSRNEPAAPAEAAARRSRLGGGLALALACAGLLGGSAPPRAEEAVRLEARIDKDHAALGEPITLTVTARHAAPLRWEAKSVADRLGPFDVEQVSGPRTPAPQAPGADPNAAAGERTTVWVFRLAAFELGKTGIPSFPIRYVPEGGGEPQSISIPSLKVEIVPTVTDPNVEAADIRQGFSLRDGSAWIRAAAFATVLVAAGIFGWWLLRRLRGAPAAGPAGPGAPPRPAYDRYREALEALLRSGLLEAGRIKEFHVEIAEILKRYLGEVYAFDAVDRTTWEVMQDLASGPAPPSVRAEAGAFLNACDLVKFAKHVPDTDERRFTVERARRILDLARPSPPPPVVEAGAVPAAVGGGAAP